MVPWPQISGAVSVLRVINKYSLACSLNKDPVILFHVYAIIIYTNRVNLNMLGPEQNGHHLTNDIFKYTFLK